METLIYGDQDKEAIVYLPKTHIDHDTIKQLKNLINHPSVDHVRIMPDCHIGPGCCVGFTSIISDKLVPNFIGGDIGCGILTYKLSEDMKTKKLEKLEARIRQAIPLGNGKEYIHKEPIVEEKDLEELFRDCSKEADSYVQNIKRLQGIDISEYKPEYSQKWLDQMSKKVNTNHYYDLQCLGTLGGGNHYIEINQDTEGFRYFTVHSGSRKLGRQICMYHQNNMDDHTRFDWDTFNDKVAVAKKTMKKKDLKKYRLELTEELKSEQRPNYLEGTKMYDYVFDMIFAQKYAQLNRKLMLRSFLYIVSEEYHPDNLVESIHNYLDFEKMVMRKGAISAKEGEKCIVSLNMRDGILICQGKGNPEWNYSAAHGLGRFMSRQDASHTIQLKDFIKSMENVYSTSVCKETVDESPMAYKDVELIKNAITPTVDIIEQLIPIINVKAC